LIKSGSDKDADRSRIHWKFEKGCFNVCDCFLKCVAPEERKYQEIVKKIEAEFAAEEEERRGKKVAEAMEAKKRAMEEDEEEEWKLNGDDVSKESHSKIKI